jgi:hypothetical protein
LERIAITKNQLSVIPTDNKYAIVCYHEQENWLHDMTHDHLADAINFLNKIGQHGSIDLRHWRKTKDDYNFILLINSLKPHKYKTHIWDGQDSYCNMWSTGGLKKDRHILSKEPVSEFFCSNCVDQYRRLVHQTKQKQFDATYRLIDHSTTQEDDNIDPSLF